MKGDVLFNSTKEKMKKKILCMAIVLFLVLPYVLTNISYGAGEDVTFTVSKLNAKRGGTITVVVDMNCTNNFAAANFVLTYNSNVLEYVPYTNGGEVDYTQNCGSTILNGGSPTATIMINSNTAGTLKIGYMSQSSVAGKSGDFLKFKFNVKSNATYGNSDITLNTTTLKNANGNDLTATFNAGTVGVLSGITINNTSLTMTTGDQSNLSVSTSNGTIFDTVTWSSSNSSVASVTVNTDTKTAKVNAVSAGNATITATVGGFSDTCTVTVKNPEEQYTISIDNPSWTFLPATQKRSLSVSFTPSSSATGKTITWSSSKTSVATINSTSGMITAVSNGTTTITATDNNGKTATYTLTVSGKLGDIDNDSTITSYDAYRALKLATEQTGGTTPNANDVVVLDVEKNGDISSGDAFKILKFSVGLITDFSQN